VYFVSGNGICLFIIFPPLFGHLGTWNTTTSFLRMGKSDCLELSAGTEVFLTARSAAVG
jgi:hypothetical protein